MTTTNPSDYIDAYTRADALRDGVLFDVTGFVRGWGFGLPLAFTLAAVAALGEDEPAGDENPARECLPAIIRAAGAAREALERAAPFAVPTPDGRGTIRLVISIHPGDRGEPVATIMLEGED